mgnify:FL=1
MVLNYVPFFERENMEEFLQVGVISSTHGIAGEVKVFPTTDDVKRFKKLKEVILDTGKERMTLHICQVKFFKQMVILKFKEFQNINEVERFRGKSLYVTRENAVKLQKDEYFIASDATPIVEYTDKVVYLEDGEIAVIHRGQELKIVTQDNIAVNPTINTIELNLGQLEKGGYPHFMLKEIFEQPDCIHDCMRGRINIEGTDIALSAIIDHKEKLLHAKRFIIVACGTSWHAALIGKYLIEKFCRFPVEVEYASEFRYRNPVINPGDVVIAISQSGETADTLAAVEEAKNKGAFIYGICNAVGSSIPRATHTGSYIHVGPEIGVASTKAFTGQVTVLTMLALTLAREKNSIGNEEFRQVVHELSTIPEKMKKVLEKNDSIANLSQIFTYAHNFIYLGRGFNYPVALEGALKLKEISYIHAEGYPAAEMKHGPIALIDTEMPVVVVATHNNQYEKIISNIQEIKARKGKVIALVTEGDTTIKNIGTIYVNMVFSTLNIARELVIECVIIQGINDLLL